MRIGAYIGRFNPFHHGHANTIDRLFKDDNDVIIIMVGSSGLARDTKNPFSFVERREMISTYIEQKGFSKQYQIVPLYDNNSDTQWISQVQSWVNAITNMSYPQESADVHLYGSDRDSSTWYLHAFPSFKLNLLPEFVLDEDTMVNATSVRKALFSTSCAEGNYQENLSHIVGKVPESTWKFLRKWIINNPEIQQALHEEYVYLQDYKIKCKQYPDMFVTADAAIIQSGHILVIERANMPGKGLWALPGGFVNQNERIKDAAIREVLEETGIRLTTGKRSEEITKHMLGGSIKASTVFDNPSRSLRTRIVTHAFLFRLDDSKSLPAVMPQNVPLHETGGEIIPETSKVFWLPTSTALEQRDKWFEDHHQIVSWAVSTKD